MSKHPWRKIVIERFATILFLIVLATLPALAQSTNHRQQVTAVGAVGMTVADMERSLQFYTGVLPFEQVSDVEVWGEEYERLQGVFGLRMRVVRLQLGEEYIELTDFLAPEGRPIPVDARSNDHWFQHIAIVVNDMDKAYQHLRKHKVQHASTGPQTIPAWNQAAAGIRAFYFKDPDNHNLEIIYFPPGKGNSKWQNSSDRLFLGIDHTAIVVSDTDQSLKFYSDLLGLQVAGESMNYGTEQEHLNNVFGARLRISGLKAPKGPGIEFLEYLAPRDGRPASVDLRANDLAHWQTTLIVTNAELAFHQAKSSSASLVSPETVSIPSAQLGFNSGFLVRDPDGHAMRIVAQ